MTVVSDFDGLSIGQSIAEVTRFWNVVGREKRQRQGMPLKWKIPILKRFGVVSLGINSTADDKANQSVHLNVL